jgi:hypothetical protein
LNGRVQIGEVYDGKTGGASRRSLEKTGKEAETSGEVGDSVIVKLASRSAKDGYCFRGTYVENDEKEQVDAVEEDEHPKQPPIGLAGKEECETATRVVEQETEFFPDAAAAWDTFGTKPNDEAEHAGKPRVANDY